MTEAYVTDLLQGKILKAIQEKEKFRDITAAECIELDRKRRYTPNI
jgi:hypothetical protein